MNPLRILFIVQNYQKLYLIIVETFKFSNTSASINNVILSFVSIWLEENFQIIWSSRKNCEKFEVNGL